MSTFGRYLIYRLRNSVLRTIIFTLIAVIFTLNAVSASIDYEDVAFRSVALPVFATLLGFLCAVMPMLETSGFKNRRNLDTLYFFPIARQKMALVHYISGFIQVCVIYTVAFMTSFIYLLVKTDCFALGYMVGYYCASLVIGLVIYSIVIFLYGQTNTDTDGIFFTVMWIFAISLVALAIFTFLQRIVNTEDNLLVDRLWNMLGWGIVYVPINNLTVIFQDLIEINNSYYSEYAVEYARQWYMFVAWGFVGIAAAWGYVYTFTRKGAQKVGEISDSPFGYRLLIPLYGYSLLFITGSVGGILIVPIFAMMIIGYIVYRRTVKLKARDLIVTACGFIPAVLGMILFA